MEIKKSYLFLEVSVFILSVVFIYWCCPSQAADMEEQRAFERIVSIVSHRPHLEKKLSPHDVQRCSVFLQDLTNGGADIQVIAPDFRTDDEDDPRLRQEAVCKKGEAGPEEEKNEYWIGNVGQRAFKVYKLLNPVTHKPMAVIYGEMVWGRRLLNQMAGYSVINPDRCTVEGGTNVNQALLPDGRTVDNYSVIVRYHDAYYALALSDPAKTTNPASKPAYWLDFMSLTKNKKGSWCSWSENVLTEERHK